MESDLRRWMRLVESEADDAFPHVVDDDGDVAHAKYAAFDDDGEAYIRFWKSTGDVIVLQTMHSSVAVRGRDMLKWLNQTFRCPIIVVEATPEAMGFWKKMRRERLIQSIQPARGFPSPLEKSSVPLTLP